MTGESVPALEQALASLPPDAEHHRDRADLLLRLALALRESEQWDRMVELADQAAHISEAAGYRLGIARSVAVRGFVSYIRADYAAALQLCSHAIELAADDLETASRTQGILALVHWSLGNYDEAFRHGTEAIQAYQRLGLAVDEAYGYASRGGILQSLGRYEQAEESLRGALERFRAVGSPVGQARVLAGLAGVANALGRSDEALEYVQESLRLARQAQHTLGISRALNDLGEVFASRGELDQASQCYSEALEIRRREGYKQAEATTLLNIGRLHEQRGEYPDALQTLRAGLAIVEQIGALPKVRDYHSELARVYEATRQLDRALEHYKAFAEVRARISTGHAEARQHAIELESKLLWAQKDAEIQRLRNVELKKALEDLRAMQAELVNSEKLAALGSLVAALAHEFNTPLGVIQSASDLTLRCAEKIAEAPTLSLLETLRTNATLMSRAAARLASVVQRLKSFAGIDQAAYQQIDLSELI